MDRVLTDLKQIVQPKTFQKVQDDISLATGLAIITVDYKGTPITKHSNSTTFCQKMRRSKYSKYCERCDSHGGLEAARLRKPFIYICYAGIIDFAIPIIVDDLYLGAFMGGQVLLEQKESRDKLEHVLHGVNVIEDIMREDDLRADYEALPRMKLSKVIALANMLLHIGNLSIEDALLKEKIKQYENMGQHQMLVQTKINTLNDNLTNKSRAILQPALTYIQTHPDEKITLSHMAKLCNVSSSYFSKLFKKEQLGSLSEYVNQSKINYAIELLQTTDWSIQTISSNVGFSDSGYFIKVFKHFVGKTPLDYRNENQSNL